MDKNQAKEQLKQVIPPIEDFEKFGLPTGDDKESVKARLLKILEDAGVIEALSTPAEQQEFAKNLDALAQAMVDKDAEALNSNPIIAMLEQIFPQQPTGGQVPQQAAAPKDFASMMPPAPGGGMSGR